MNVPCVLARRLLPALLVLAASCGDTQTKISVDKGRVAGSNGKADDAAWASACAERGEPANCDLCESSAWYSDGTCDVFCPNRDADCDAPSACVNAGGTCVGIYPGACPNGTLDGTLSCGGGVGVTCCVPGSTTTDGFVAIPAGTFTMGSPEGENCRSANFPETQHAVTLTHDFEIMSTEITQGSFQALMGYNPSYFHECGDNCPVDAISWYEAAAYCNAISAQNGHEQCYSCTGSGEETHCEEVATYSGPGIYNCSGYRLPTEAEWEYAYRAGTPTALHNSTEIVNCDSSDDNTNDISWNLYNSQNDVGWTPHEVGGRSANNWGVFDMAGNLFEWVSDWYMEDLGSGSVIDPFGPASGTFKVYRSGSCGGRPRYIRAASREQDPLMEPGVATNLNGARCVRTR
jgi:formylglycine-generating enzyme required for sulfatase activity